MGQETDDQKHMLCRFFFSHKGSKTLSFCKKWKVRCKRRNGIGDWRPEKKGLPCFPLFVLSYFVPRDLVANLILRSI